MAKKKFFQIILIGGIISASILYTGCHLSEDATNDTEEIIVEQESTSEEETTKKVEEVYSTYRVCVNEIALHEEPNDKSNVMWSYRKNDLIQVADVGMADWKKAKHEDGLSYYIKSEEVEPFTGDYTLFAEYQMANKVKKYGMVSVSSGNIRSLPDVTEEATIVGNFTQGEVVEILGTTKNGWNLIDYNGEYCYISPEIVTEITEEEYKIYSLEPERVDISSNYHLTLIGSYLTNYAPVTTNRGNNVEKASTEISGMIILPNGTFNWCRDMGPCGKEEGYKEANEYQNGQLVLGYGGGICQISSTLCAAFSTAWEGKFEFLERHNHYKPQKYIPIELDATVSYPNTNLIIQNQNNYKIMIKSYYSDGEVTVELYKIDE